METTIKRIGIVMVVSLALAGCGSSGGDDDTHQAEYQPYDAPVISESDKAAYLNAINDARAEGRNCGENYPFSSAVPPLVWNDSLYKAAYEHTEDMVASELVSHTGSGTESDWTAQILELGRGSSWQERISNNGLPDINVSENIHVGFTDVDSMINSQLSSPWHCINIMDSEFTKLGVAKIEDHWTLTFAQ